MTLEGRLQIARDELRTLVHLLIRDRDVFYRGKWDDAIEIATKALAEIEGGCNCEACASWKKERGYFREKK